MATLSSLTINDTGNITLPQGTNANRPTVNTSVVSFTSVGSTTWTVPAGVSSVEVLVVAGGGGGGSEHGGGGGGGGVVHQTAYAVTPGASIPVTVGGGGAGGTYSATNGGGGDGTTGNNSSFGSLIAYGGGGGVAYKNSGSYNAAVGKNGGSGGGGGPSNPGFVQGNTTTPWGSTGLQSLGGEGVLGQGCNGGIGGFPSIGGNYTGGGGGGAGGVGGNSGASPTDAFGGPGRAFDISGTLTYYGGGGGSSYYGSSTSAPGGIGGGGASGNSSSFAGTAGTTNTGGGGGGSYDNAGSSAVGGAGGSGIVIVRYSLTSASENPIAQTRFNTSTKSLETFDVINRFSSKIKGEPIVTNGLTCYLDPLAYSGSGTTITDLTRNGNNGTLNGTITYDSSIGYWDLGSTANTSNYITIPAAAINGATEYTVSLWLYVNVTNSIDTFFTCGPGNDVLYFFNGRNLVNHQNTAGVDFQYKTNIREWIHFTAVAKNNFVTLYKNGKFVDKPRAQSSTANVTSTLGIVLGNEMDSTSGNFENGQAYLGRYGPIMLYKRALSAAEIEKNYNAHKGRFGTPAPMLNLGNGSIGSSPGTAAESARQIKELTGTNQNGFYWIKPGNLDPILLWCDMNYDGGGWALVLCNCKAGVFTGAPGTNGIGALNYQQAVHNNNINGTFTNKLEFRQFVGAKYWVGLGLNAVQFCSTTTPTLSNTAAHTKRYRWSYTGMSSLYAFQGGAAGTDETGTGSPGFYSHNVAGGYNLTTTDRDQDTYGSNCANLYGGTPNWYSACWSGNPFGGGNSGGYQDGPFWDGSGSDYHNYMAIYLKV